MSNDDTVDSGVEISGFRNEREIGKASVVEIAHVHAAIEHDSLAIDGHHCTALPHLLPCA